MVSVMVSAQPPDRVEPDSFGQPGEDRLSAKALRATVWAFGLKAADRLLRFARTFVLARLLSPHDFGLFGLALLAISALHTFSQTGFNAALVQKREDPRPFLNPAWTFQVLRGVALAAVVFLLAPAVASFFSAPQAEGVVRALALSTLLQGFTNIGVVLFQKELEFGKRFAYMAAGTAADVCVALTAAFLLRNVWALVLGFLAGDLTRLIASYVASSYRPRLSLDWKRLGNLAAFGKWVTLSTILIFFVTQIDDAFVGKVLGVTALGLYQLAYSLANAPVTAITHTMIEVVFPTYSKVQNSPERLREGILRTVRLVSLISFPLVGGILATAPGIAHSVLGDQWLPIVPIVRILCPYAAARSVMGILGALVTSVGRPDLEAKVNVVQLVIIVALIYPLALAFGVAGVAITITIQSLASFFILIGLATPLIGLRRRELLAALLFPSLGTLIMVVAVAVVAGPLPLQILSGAAVYLTLCLGSYRLRPQARVFDDVAYIANLALGRRHDAHR